VRVRVCALVYPYMLCLGLNFTRPWLFHVVVCWSFWGLGYLEYIIFVYVVGITQVVSVKSLALCHSQHHDRIKHHINTDIETTTSRSCVN
jgi:hypothetical protein